MARKIYDFFRAFFITLVLTLVFLMVSTLLSNKANAVEPIQLDEVYIDFRNYFPGGRYPMITDNGLPNREIGQGLDVNINSSILGVMYWNSKVNSMTDRMKDGGGGGQFRLVGLEMELGFRFFSFLDAGYYHHSQHMLDGSYQNWSGFPVEDGIQVKINLYNRNPKQSLF